MTWFLHYMYFNKAIPPNSATPWTKHIEMTIRPMISSTLMFSAMSLKECSRLLLTSFLKLPFYIPALLDFRNWVSCTHTPSPLAMSYFTSPQSLSLFLDHNLSWPKNWFLNLHFGKQRDWLCLEPCLRVLLRWRDTMTAATHIKKNVRPCGGGARL